MAQDKQITRRQALKYGVAGGIAAVTGLRLASWGIDKIGDALFPTIEPRFSFSLWSPEAIKDLKYSGNGISDSEIEYAHKNRSYIKIDMESIRERYGNTEIDVYNGMRIAERKKFEDFPIFYYASLLEKEEVKPTFEFLIHQKEKTKLVGVSPVFLSKKALLEKMISRYKDHTSESPLKYPQAVSLFDGDIRYDIYGPEALTSMTPEEFNQYWIMQTKTP